MDFSLTSEQQLVKDTVERFIRDRYGINAHLAALSSDAGFDRGIWHDLAELGLLAVPFSERYAGLGSGVDIMIVMQALGRGLVVEPYLSTTVLAGSLLEASTNTALAGGLIEQIIAGTALAAFAHTEPRTRYTLSFVDTEAKVTAAGITLNGHKAVVLNGDTADKLIVSARLSGEVTDTQGIGLFLVDSTAPGLTVQGYPSIDGRRVAEVTLNNVQVHENALLIGPERGYQHIESAVARASVGICAEAVGAMEKVCELTLDYLKTRQQFGKHIGSFQILAHKMVDMRVALEQARSLTILAAAKLDEPVAVREPIISAAKVMIGQSGRFIAENAIQLHGGIGITWEYALSHYAKRLIMIDHWFGDVDHHLVRFAELTDQNAKAGMANLTRIAT